MAVKAAKSTEKSPTVLSIDKEVMPKLEGCHFIAGDLMDEKMIKKISDFFQNQLVNVVRPAGSHFAATSLSWAIVYEARSSLQSNLLAL